MEAITKILIGVDFSEVSPLALRAGYTLARRLKAELVLTHVVERPSFILAGDLGFGSHGMMEEYEALMKSKLSDLARELPSEGMRVQLQVAHGKPHQMLADMAQAEHAQLIVVGHVGRTGLSHLLLGSVAERLLRTAQVPVMVVHKPSEAATQQRAGGLQAERILVPFDFSEHAQQAVHFAAQLARGGGARISLLYVLDAAALPLPNHVPEERGASVVRLRGELGRLLENEQKRLSEELAMEVNAELVQGLPREEIVHRAAAGHFDLLVMGTHGRAGISRALLGSVAEGVLREASCTAIAVPLRS